MRDLKIKFKLIWLLLTDQYTASRKDKIWWLWDNKQTQIDFK